MASQTVMRGSSLHFSFRLAWIVWCPDLNSAPHRYTDWIILKWTHPIPPAVIQVALIESAFLNVLLEWKDYWTCPRKQKACIDNLLLSGVPNFWLCRLLMLMATMHGFFLVQHYVKSIQTMSRNTLRYM